MKRIVALSLVFSMCLILCSCGGMTKEEMLETATELEYFELNKSASENLVAAETKYTGNTYIIEGETVDITGEYVAIGNGSLEIRAKLSKEDVALVKKGEYVKIVGEMGKFESGTDGDVIVNMDTAHFVDNIYEVMVYIEVGNGNNSRTAYGMDFEAALDPDVDEDDVNRYTINFENVESKGMTTGDVVTVKGTKKRGGGIVGYYTDYVIYATEIVEHVEP